MLIFVLISDFFFETVCGIKGMDGCYYSKMCLTFSWDESIYLCTICYGVRMLWISVLSSTFLLNKFGSKGLGISYLKMAGKYTFLVTGKSCLTVILSFNV